jgi:amino acid adenylation domain-containing protein
MRRLIQSYADIQADYRPAAKAVVLGNEQLSYGELHRWSNSLARALQFHGCRRGDRIGLAVSKSPSAIASILGILKADCIYVPLDVESPVARTSKILVNSEPRLTLVDASGINSLEELRSNLATCEFKIASIDGEIPPSDRDRYAFCADDIVQFPNTLLLYENEPDDVAYILYTSGSTGAPKGVPITHASVAQFIDWAVSYFGFTSQDRISGHPPLHFDLSVFDIFGAFAGGAELHLVPASLNVSAQGMAEFIRSSCLTQWFSVPSALNYMAKFDVVQHGDFPSLKRVLWCGEVLPTPTLRYWMQRLPDLQFTNLYGPTEATIASSYYTIESMPQEDESIPIGRACDGESLLVLDEALRPARQGAIGELYIGGAGLSPGYWKDEEKTRDAFLRSSYVYGRIYKTGDLAKVGRDGLTYFAGRADSQIKSRGYRIELGEIEAALNRVEDLKESAVVAIPTNEFAGWQICCAFASAAGAQITVLTLRETLRTALPHYMLPGRWLSMDGLPKNANGKIDRPLLKELFQREVNAATGKDSLELRSIEV